MKQIQHLKNLDLTVQNLFKCKEEQLTNILQWLTEDNELEKTQQKLKTINNKNSTQNLLVFMKMGWKELFKIETLL